MPRNIVCRCDEALTRIIAAPPPHAYIGIMEEDDGEYLLRRAEAELEMAQRSEVAPAVKAHYELAEAYLERAAEIVAEESRANA